MHLVWEIILILVPGLAFIGQLISFFFPRAAARAGLTEHETEVDPAFYADVRGEVLWDSLVLWILPAAAVASLLEKDVWVWLCLVGGGMYVYFSGRGIVTRLSYRKRSIQISGESGSTTALIFLSMWGLTGLLAILLAIRSM